MALQLLSTNRASGEISDNIRSRKVMQSLKRRGSGCPPKKEKRKNETIGWRGAQIS